MLSGCSIMPYLRLCLLGCVMPSADEAKANPLTAYADWPAYVSQEGGIEVCIFPPSREQSWVLEGARPTVELVEPGDTTPLESISGSISNSSTTCSTALVLSLLSSFPIFVSGAQVDTERGCVVVTVPALPDMAIPKWENVEDGIKYVGVRVRCGALLCCNSFH